MIVKLAKNAFLHRKQVLEGWKNFYFRKVTIEEVADVRRAICKINDCGNYDTKGAYISCNDCGCPIEKKIRSLSSKCPENLWGYVNELTLIITPALFEKTGFYVDKVVGDVKYYRHKKYSEIIFLYHSDTKYVTNGIKVFDYWKDIEIFFKDKTGKKLN